MAKKGADSFDSYQTALASMSRKPTEVAVVGFDDLADFAALGRRPRQYADDYMRVELQREEGFRARRRKVWESCPQHLRGLMMAHVHDTKRRHLSQRVQARRIAAAEERARRARETLRGFRHDQDEADRRRYASSPTPWRYR